MMMRKNEAVILAGGFGTRLRTVVHDLPKAMAPINGRPFLEYQLDYLIANSFNKAVLAIGYKGKMIQTHFGSNYKTLKLEYSAEERPLGTGGALAKAMGMIEREQFFALNGDTFFGAPLTSLEPEKTWVLGAQVDNVSRYGCLELAADNQVMKIWEKKKIGPGIANSGVYRISKKDLQPFTTEDSWSLEDLLLPRLIDRGELFCRVSGEPFIDIGVPQDYEAAQLLIENTSENL